MDRKDLGRIAALLTLIAAFTWLPVTPASAQFGRLLVTSQVDGEPTDPDKALAVVDQSDVDLDAYGLKAEQPADQAESVSWFEAVLNLLRALGLLPAQG